MPNRKNAGTSDSKFGRLDDEHVLELAEEVLGSSDDDIIILDDETDTASDESEDIIDLTDANDIPIEDEEEILDLTDELEEATDEDTEIFELQDIADQADETDEEILELDDTVDAFADTEPDDDIMTLEEAVEDADDTEDDIIDLEKAVADDAGGDEGDGAGETAETREFSIETDTIELSEADRQALEAEFGFEPETGLEDENLTLPETQPEDVSEASTAEMEDTLELAELPDAPDGGDSADTAELESDPIIELTDEDRSSLEEALSTEMFEDSEESMQADIVTETEAEEDELMVDFPEEKTGETAPPEPVEMDLAAQARSEMPEQDEPPLQDSLQLPAEETDAPEAVQTASEAEIQFDVQDAETGGTEEFGALNEDWAAEAAAQSPADDQPPEEELRLDFADDQSPAETASDRREPETDAAEGEIPLDFQDASEELPAPALSQAAEPVPETAEPAAEERQAVEPSFEPDSQFAEETMEETIDVGSLYESPAEPGDTESTEAAQATEEGTLTEDLGFDLEENQGAREQDLQIDFEGAPDAQADTEVEDTEAITQAEDDFIESLGMTIESEMASPEDADETPSARSSEQDPGVAVDFDHPEGSEAADLHKTADNISIRVQEHAEDNHSNEDQLLSKVFQADSESADSSSLEDKVERLVNKLFAEKIEAILVNAIERAVTKEIDRLKSALLGELNRRD
jgi:hypothetical protein